MLFLRKVKGLSCRSLSVIVLALSLCVSAFASEGNEAAADVSSVITQITTGLSGQAGAILAGLGAIAAAGIVIFAAQLAIRLGLKAFKAVTGR